MIWKRRPDDVSYQTLRYVNLESASQGALLLPLTLRDGVRHFQVSRVRALIH